MMAFTDRWGERTDPVEPMTVTDADITKSRDMTLVKLRMKNLSWRKIGRYLNISDQGARKRYLKLPPDVRQSYERSSMIG